MSRVPDSVKIPSSTSPDPLPPERADSARSDAEQLASDERSSELVVGVEPGAQQPGPQRFVTVWCADWPVVAAGCRPDVAAAVMRSHRVVARTVAATDDGVVVGQRRRQAQQRSPHIDLFDDDPARDAREFEPVVRAVADVAPRLDVIEPGWISFAAHGPSRYFGGDDALAEHLTRLVIEVLAGAGRNARGDDGTGRPPEPTTGAGNVTAESELANPIDGEPRVSIGVGVADGRFAASVAARLAVRRGSPVVIDAGGSSEFCSSLPIGWLQTLGEIDADLADLFARLGMRRLGELASLPASDVFGRFGRAGIHAHRLASGDDARPASTADPAPERRLDRVLDDPAAQSEAVVFVAKQLADQIAGSLASDGRVCTRLVVQFETEHGERSERSWYRSAGMSAAAMVERVRWQLDGWVNLPRGSEHEITGGVALIRLIPDEVRADEGVQLGLWGGQSEADRRAARAIARLTTLTSEQAVTVPVWQGGRLPADRYRWVPATMVDLDHRSESVAASSSSGPWPGCLPAPSPATVFDESRLVEIVDFRGEAVTVSGRGMVSSPPAMLRLLVGSEEDGWRRGASSRIASWAGPWPIDQQWWEPDKHRRLARFQIVTEHIGSGISHDPDGAIGESDALLVIAEHRRWWIAAVYD